MTRVLQSWRAVFVGLTLTIGFSATAWAAPNATSIDLDRLTCVGNRTFAADKIVAALGGDLEWAAAESSRMPSSERLKLLAARIARGYANAGFPDAQFAAEQNAKSGETTLRVEEGPRCLMGKVRVDIRYLEKSIARRPVRKPPSTDSHC